MMNMENEIFHGGKLEQCIHKIQVSAAYRKKLYVEIMDA